METVAQPPADADAELNLLTDWGDQYSQGRTRKAAVGSVLFHIVLILTLSVLPGDWFKNPPPPQEVHRTITPLIEPLTELTQKAPNKSKVTKEFNATEVEPKPRIQIPSAPPSTTRPRAQRQAGIPGPPAPKPEPAKPLPEPPKVEAAVKAPELPQSPVTAPTPPPQIQTSENPFITPNAAPTGPAKAAPPNASVSDAIRQLARGGGSGGGITVGDPEAAGVGGHGSGINLPPSPGSQASNIQLLSDPLGVDFRSYLTRVLASVKLHWLAVLPESARMGRQGKVAIQFSIIRSGRVGKLVIASASGADALDRAAVAGISASDPFPPLPTEFKGDRIVLQFNFAYNIPSRQ